MNPTPLLPITWSSPAKTPEVKAPARILIVDDEESIRAFVQRVLLEAGYEAVVATDGEEAIRIAGQTPIDLLLTDETMPLIPGHALAQRLRSQAPALKVLYLTGFSDRLFENKHAMWAGEAFLDKPATQKALLEAVSLLLYGRLKPAR